MKLKWEGEELGDNILSWRNNESKGSKTGKSSAYSKSWKKSWILVYKLAYYGIAYHCKQVNYVGVDSSVDRGSRKQSSLPITSHFSGNMRAHDLSC